MKFLYSFILSLSSVYGFSQTILYQQETTSRTVQDPQAVVLTNGFHASASSSNPFVAKIGPSTESSGGGPTDSNAGAGNPSGTTSPSGQSFHDTKGNIEVNGAGQLQFTLPIALPPGVKSVAPQVNLVYTSGSGNGIAGYGWNLSGITAISRMGKTIETNGEPQGIQLNGSDYYSFNGQRLILKSGEYGKDGAEYVTEKYSNVKIKSVGVGSFSGPAHFEVIFEDGSQAWYGANSSARTPVEYNIVKWRDAQGNYITYTYLQSNTTLALISHIQWGGNETLNTSHFNEIRFTYANRNMREKSYVQGTEFLQSQILSEIKVISNTKQFKRYSIQYTNNTASAYQFIQEIKEYNADDQPANPISFQRDTTTDTGWKTSYFTDDKDKKVTGDFDGDGKIDFLKYQDAQNICTEYTTESENDPEDGFIIREVCTKRENKPAGIYLYTNFLDGGGLRSTYLGTGNFTKEEFNNTATVLTLKDKQGRIPASQGIVVAKKVNGSAGAGKPDLSIDLYSISNNQLSFEYSKVIPNSQYDNSTYQVYDYNNGTRSVYEVRTSTGTMTAMDLDADGISEVFVALHDDIRREDPCYTATGEMCIPETTTENRNRYIIINADKDLSSSQSVSNISFYPYDQTIENIYKFGDFNGDGKVDFMRFDSRGVPVLMTFQKNPTNLRYTTRELPFGSATFPGLKSAALVGDVNGDGQSDLMIPAGEGSFTWYLLTSTGNGFTQQTLDNFSYYKPYNYFTEGNQGYTRVYYYWRSYFFQDVNKDGKADFIEFFNHSRRNRKEENHFSQFDINILENKGYLNNDTNITFRKNNITGNPVISYTGFNRGLAQYPFLYTLNGVTYETRAPRYATPKETLPFSPMVGDFRIHNTDSQILIVKKGMLLQYKHSDIGKEARVTSITQGGIQTSIEYKELDPNINSNMYQGVKKELYPYIEMDKLSQTFAVSQIRQGGVKQDFRYRGFISHLQGRGSIGFRQTARSSWYADGFENTKIWSGAEMDPLNEGVPVKEWSIRTNNENLIFPADISENNTQLLSFKSTVYDKKQLVNGQVVTSVAAADKAKVVVALMPTSSRTKDFLTNTTTSNTVTYNSYYLPERSETRVNNNLAVTTSTFDYTHNPSGVGANYFIGRPRSKEDVVQAYGDTKRAKEEYTYENNLVKTQVNWNRNNSGSITETYSYDGFGNITKKVTSNSLDAQTQTAETLYESKGRFVAKKKDNLGLETNILYNDWGQILTQTDPLGNTLTNTYDAWGKLLASKTNLSGTTTYQYERDSNANIIITQQDSDGNVSKKYTNKLGQEYKTSTKAFRQGQWVSVQTEYDVLGRKVRASEPYFEGQAANQWNTMAYDDSVFPAKVTTTSFNGQRAETSVSGFTTTVRELTGYGRTQTKTTDALGNVVATTDKGGTINFSYNAAGEQIKAQYAENIVTTSYDVWGRKSEFNDPSNGVYKYEYNGFGQPTKTISPKGTKEYAYNIKGQLVSQRELSTTDGGEATNKSISFSYDDNGRVIAKSGTSKGQPYSSSVAYDAQGRLLSSSESSNGKYFIQKGITYDDKARVISYEKQLYSSGTLTKVQVENVYNNWSGELVQVKDKQTGRSLWQLDETNAKGQVLKAKLGASNITNTYAADGFLTGVNHSSSAKPSILQLSYSFDAIKNELKSRTTGGDFNIIESFDYDDNNRLVNWTNPVTGVKPSSNRNVYDVKGRILENDQVGSIKFQNNQKIYQPTSMVLNTAGTQNYNNDLIQSISYNENNDPVFIDGEKGDVAFQYGLTSMRQRVSYGGNFNANGEGKFTKFYSEDGSFEVIKDNTTGREKHILYIGGTPYESNIVYLKDFAQSSGSFRFLHKDYIGSILAISDEAGNKLEQRHFDAWGNFTHLKMGNAATLNGNALKEQLSTMSLVVDRGYTSHEHFDEVGIIHMNGRLYDPLLRRFLNADENIQDPTNTQNYNKYGYVLNNPLMYNDPSGEIFILPFLAAMASKFLAGMISAAIIGAAVSVAAYSLSAALTGYGWNIGAALKSMAFGAISGAVTFGIGSVFTTSADALTKLADALGTVGTAFVKGGMHAISQGTLSLMQGNNFGQAFLSAAMASLGASAFGAATGEITNQTLDAVSTIAFGAVTGGVGSAMAGGNFWQGALIGGVVAGLNDVMHKLGNSSQPASDGNDGDGDCLTCPKNAKPGDTYIEKPFSLLDKDTWGNFGQTKTYTYFAGKWLEMKLITGDVPFGGPGGGIKNIVKAVHGNSLKSLKPTWGYKLYDETGKFLKNGITSKLIPETRYTKAFMADKYMIRVKQFQNRLKAWKWEFKQNQINRGPWNKNMH